MTERSYDARIAALLAQLPDFKEFLDTSDRWSKDDTVAPNLLGLSVEETIELLMLHPYYYASPGDRDDQRRRYLELWERHDAVARLPRTPSSRRLH